MTPAAGLALGPGAVAESPAGGAGDGGPAAELRRLARPPAPSLRERGPGGTGRAGARRGGPLQAESPLGSWLQPPRGTAAKRVGGVWLWGAEGGCVCVRVRRFACVRKHGPVAAELPPVLWGCSPFVRAPGSSCRVSGLSWAASCLSA